MRSFLICVLVGWALNAHAQEFGTHWVSFPVPDDSTQVWFRNTYRTQGRPSQASVSIVSTGHFELYVNGRNVSGDVLIPYQEPDEDGLVRVTYDISRFLRFYSNTLAIWYAPVKGTMTDKQLSVCFWGEEQEGTPFSHYSNEGWLCKAANAWQTADGGEYVNSLKYDTNWYGGNPQLTTWTRPMVTNDGKTSSIKVPIEDVQGFYPALRIARSLEPIHVEEDSLGITYDFGREFDGWVRVTLRKAKKGETIHIGNLTYVCNGSLDEQACRRFTIGRQQRVRIWGDARFQKSQIQTVEALEIKPTRHHSYRY